MGFDHFIVDDFLDKQHLMESSGVNKKKDLGHFDTSFKIKNLLTKISNNTQCHIIEQRLHPSEKINNIKNAKNSFII